MICGTAPALMTFLIRLFARVEKVAAQRDKGATSYWATRDLLAVLIGATGPALIVFLWADREEPYSAAARLAGTAVGLAVATLGYIYPVMRYMQRFGLQRPRGARPAPTITRMILAAGLSGVASWAPGARPSGFRPGPTN